MIMIIFVLIEFYLKCKPCPFFNGARLIELTTNVSQNQSNQFDLSKEQQKYIEALKTWSKSIEILV